MIEARLAKITMVASLAAFALLAAYNNIVDYDSNFEFVRHVLSMDTTFPGNALKHRAVTLVHGSARWRSEPARRRRLPPT